MEITLLSQGSIKIRSKIANFVVDPSSNSPKTEADAIISLDGVDPNVSKISEFRVILTGPGEYEVKGVKISSTREGGGTVYKLSLDKMEIILSYASVLSKLENTTPAHIVVINADEVPSDKVITAIQPSVIVLYGAKAAEAAKTLKEGSAAPVNKFVTSFEKLPQEMEVVTLG